MNTIIPRRISILIALLALPLVLIAGCDSGSDILLTEDEAAALAASPAQYIPNDVGFLFLIKMDDIMADAWAADVVNQGMEENPEVRDQFAALGLDPATDIKEIAMGVYPGNEEQSIVGVEADVDLDDVVAKLSPKDAALVEPFEESGLKGYLVTLPDSGDQLYVVDEGAVLLAASTPTLVKKGQETKASGKSAVTTGSIAQKLSDFDTSAHMWFIADGAALADAAGNSMPMMGGGDESMPKSVVGTVDLTGGLQFDMAVEFANETTAQETATQLEGMKMMFGGQMVAQKPELKPILDAITMGADGANFEIAIYLSKNQLEDLQKMIEEQGGY